MSRRRPAPQQALPVWRLEHEGDAEVTFATFAAARRAAERSYERHGLDVQVFDPDGRLVFFISQPQLPFPEAGTVADQPMTLAQRAWVLKQRSRGPAHKEGK